MNLSLLNSVPAKLASHNSWITCYPNKTPTESNFLNRTYPLNTALRKIADNPKHKLGFVFNPELNGIVGIDLDDVTFRGDLTLEAINLIKQANTFAEFSDSGKGIHCYGYGTLAEDMRNKYILNHGSLEVYSRKRFFLFTGNHVDFSFDDINSLNLQALLPFLKSKKGKAPGAGNYALLDDYRIENIIIQNLIDTLAKCRNSGTFTRLIYGKWRGKYQTQSEADLALSTCIMYYAKSEYYLSKNFGELTDYDVQRLAFSVASAVMKQSKLYRAKWDRADYRYCTLKLAWDSVYSVYNPIEFRSEKQRQRQILSSEVRRQKSQIKVNDAIAELTRRGDKLTKVNISKLAGIHRNHVSKYLPKS